MFTFFRQPLTQQAAPRNAILGHIIATLVGLAALLIFGLYAHPNVLHEGITLPRIFAAASSVAITESLLVLLRLPHTPAGTTTLLVSLGIFTTARELTDRCRDDASLGSVLDH